MSEPKDQKVSQRFSPSVPFRWVIEFGERMHERGDRRRENLMYLALQALEAREEEPARAILLYNQARAEAMALRESWWMLFLDYLRVNVITGPMGDMIQGQEIVHAAIAEMEKPIFNRFPQRICLHEDLARIRLGVDPLGFAPEIAEGVALMEREVSPDSPCMDCLGGIKIRRAIEMEYWDEARERLLKVLAMRDEERGGMPPLSGRHKVAQKVTTEKIRASELTQLCWVAWNRQEYGELLEWARQGEETARRVDENACIAECLLWQALLAQREGDAARAQRLCHAASQEYKKSFWIPSRAYFYGLCAFHEQAGDLRLACQARAHQLNLLRGKGQIYVEAEAHAERCRLLALLGHSLESALPAARAAAQLLIDPTQALARLDQFAPR